MLIGGIMKHIIALILIALPLMLFGFTTVSGDVSGQTWSTGTYFVENYIYVEANSTLTIDEGVVVKFKNNELLIIRGTLIATGTEINPIYFTSIDDDSVGEIISIENGSDGMPVPGDWDGIDLNGYQDEHQGIGEFDWVIVRYGGKHWGNADANVHFNHSTSGHFINSVSEHCVDQAIKISSCSPDITDSIMRFSENQGIYANNFSGTLNGNTVYDNGSHGIEIDGQSYPVVDYNQCEDNDGYGILLDYIKLTSVVGNIGSSNTMNAIALSGEIEADFELSPSPDYPFVINDLIIVHEDVVFTIYPGSILKVEDDKCIEVHGTLFANGTEENRVVFTSIKDDSYIGDTNGDGDATLPEAADWSGIYLDGMNDTYQGIGEFDWVIVRYGGRHWSGAEANVAFFFSESGHFNNSISEYSVDPALRTHECSIDITNSVFRYSDNEGIRCNNFNGLISGNLVTDNGSHGIKVGQYCTPTLNNNTCNYNDGYGIYLDYIIITSMFGNTGYGNSMNGIAMSGIIEEHTILPNNGDYPYIFNSNVTVTSGNNLLIQHGAVVKIDTGNGLIVDGSVIIDGTASQPVIFTSIMDDSYCGDTNNDGDATTPTPGCWKGIHVDGRMPDDEGIGEFDWAIIRYGGQHWGEVEAGIKFNEAESGYVNNCIFEYIEDAALKVQSCSIEVNNSTFRYSQDRGIHFIESNSLVRGCTVESNAGVGIDIDGISDVNLGNNDLLDMGLNTIRGNDETDGLQIRNDNQNQINAYYNIWDYSTVSEIDAVIYDDEEDSWRGQVMFDPWFIGTIAVDLVTDSSLDFETVSGTDEITLPVTIQNIGNAPLEIWEVTVNDDAFEFEYDDTELPPTEQLTINVTFDPSIDGDYSAQLSIYNNSNNNPQIDIELIGTGLNVGNDDIVNPNQLTFAASNYPNPFNPTTCIKYTIKERAKTTLKVYNIKGRLVNTLVNDMKDAGKHEVIWNGIDHNNKHVASGVYFYRLQSSNDCLTKKMILMK